MEKTVTLSERYITDRFLPDKAIDLIDEASSKIRLKAYTAPPEIKDIEQPPFLTATLAELSKYVNLITRCTNFDVKFVQRDYNITLPN